MAKNSELRARILSLLVVSNDISISTWRIGRLLNEKALTCRLELNRMTEDGLVRRHRYSAANNIQWQLIKKEPT